MHSALEGAVHIVLRPDLETALVRANAEDVLGGLYRKFSDLHGLKPHALDTSAHYVAETVEAVRRALAAGTFRLRSIG